MKKLLVLWVFLLAVTDAAAQDIIYDLPKPVIEAINRYIQAQKNTQDYAAHLRGDSGIYTIYIYPLLPKADNVLYNKVERLTNRKVRVGTLLLPLVTPEDLLFADFGPGETRKGIPGKLKVVQNLDSYYIKFDRQGKIVDQLR